MDYLTESAEFICNQGGKISCEDSGNTKITYNGKILLTTAANVKNQVGICMIKSQPCKCQLTAWLSGFSPLKISNGKPLLTDTAKNFCSVGGEVGGQISVLNSGVFGHITAGSAPASISVAAAKILSATISDEKNKNLLVQNISDEKNKNSAEIKFRCGNSKCRNKNCPHSKNKFLEAAPVEKDALKLRKNYYKYIGEILKVDGMKIENQIESKDKNLDFCRQLCEKNF